jgi:hypothetical protein
MNLQYDKNSGADLAGRPTLYDPSFPDKVRSLCQVGASSYDQAAPAR